MDEKTFHKIVTRLPGKEIEGIINKLKKTIEEDTCEDRKKITTESISAIKKILKKKVKSLQEKKKVKKLKKKKEKANK